MLTLFFSAAVAATLTVDTEDDSVDAFPGDGVCADATAQCSLRAAVMEANAAAGPDTVRLPAGTYTLVLSGAGEAGGDLDVLDDLTVHGADRATTVLRPPHRGPRARR
jgi:hypothetical protein